MFNANYLQALSFIFYAEVAQLVRALLLHIRGRIGLRGFESLLPYHLTILVSDVDVIYEYYVGRLAQLARASERHSEC